VQQIVVTDRGRPVARIVSFSDGAVLERGVDEGWVEPPRRTELGPAERHRSQRSVLDVLDEDRG
jgi:antitoxin (DNA-binding transcriptional repressor) of toxin-antitoxin stability system